MYRLLIGELKTPVDAGVLSFVCRRLVGEEFRNCSLK